MYLQPASNRPYRVAWVIALVVHFAAFLVVFPSAGQPLDATPERSVTVIKRYRPPPPPERAEREVIKRRARPVPIPDPTPDEPEPVVSETEVVYAEDLELPDVDYVIGAPSGPPPTGPEQEVFRVGADVRRPEQIIRISPEYPELARRARLECTVILEARLGRLGDVVDVQVLRGCGLGLDEAAVDAVSRWKYAPTTLNGRPVEVAMTVTVVFELN